MSRSGAARKLVCGGLCITLEVIDAEVKAIDDPREGRQCSQRHHEAAIVIDGNFRYAVDTESYGALNFSTKKNWFFT